MAFDAYIRTLEETENEMNEESKPCGRPASDLEFYVEYSAERNIICVRLGIPSLVVNMDTSDFLMFQSNVLTFEAVSVSIELSESKGPPPVNGKPPPKIVIFKGTSSFNVKEPPL
jgi:hypothetical protein